MGPRAAQAAVTTAITTVRFSQRARQSVCTHGPAFSLPLVTAASHWWSLIRTAPHWLLIVYYVWSASLQSCSSVFPFWFHLLVFLSKTPSRHSHTRTDPTSPRCAAETEAIQERCVSLQIAASHLCPLTSALLLPLSCTFSCRWLLSTHI